MTTCLTVCWLMLPILASVGLDDTDDEKLPPYLVQTHPARVVCKECDYAELFCEAGGIPSPKIKWTKNGSPFSLNSCPHYFRRQPMKSVVETTAALVRHKLLLIRPNDTNVEGYYKCSAHNKWGTVASDVSQVILPELTRYQFWILPLSLL
jgi:hypothetical protein